MLTVVCYSILDQVISNMGLSSSPPCMNTSHLGSNTIKWDSMIPSLHEWAAVKYKFGSIRVIT